MSMVGKRNANIHRFTLYLNSDGSVASKHNRMTSHEEDCAWMAGDLERGIVTATVYESTQRHNLYMKYRVEDGFDIDTSGVFDPNSIPMKYDVIREEDLPGEVRMVLLLGVV